MLKAGGPMDSPVHADLAGDVLARVIDRVTRMHDTIMRKLAGLLAGMDGVRPVQRAPVPVTVDDRARPASR